MILHTVPLCMFSAFAIWRVVYLFLSDQNINTLSVVLRLRSMFCRFSVRLIPPDLSSFVEFSGQLRPDTEYADYRRYPHRAALFIAISHSTKAVLARCFAIGRPSCSSRLQIAYSALSILSAWSTRSL